MENNKIIARLLSILLEDSGVEETTMASSTESVDQVAKESPVDSVLGAYVIVRTRNEGVNAGYLKYADDKMCVLTDARRLWWMVSKDKKLAWYEGVAISGLDEESKCSPIVDEKIIMEDFSITILKPEAKDSIRNFPSSETTG